MSPLASDQRRALLQLARRAILLAVEERRALAISALNEPLVPPAGAFVTLRIHGRLRGCVGQIEAAEPLTAVVAHCAMAAALEDPRFPPVTLEELARLEIEISVLSALAAISPDSIEAGRHGLAISRGGKRGVLLPQVAIEQRWSGKRFLEETCRKAGLEREAWRDPAIRIEAFTAEIFSESEFRLGKKAEAG